MKSASLESYGGNLKKIAKANARDGQMEVIRSSRFRASLVADPLRTSHDLVSVIEGARKISSK